MLAAPMGARGRRRRRRWETAGSPLLRGRRPLKNSRGFQCGKGDKDDVRDRIKSGTLVNKVLTNISSIDKYIKSVYNRGIIKGGNAGKGAKRKIVKNARITQQEKRSTGSMIGARNTEVQQRHKRTHVGNKSEEGGGKQPESKQYENQYYDERTVS